MSSAQPKMWTVLRYQKLLLSIDPFTDPETAVYRKAWNNYVKLCCLDERPVLITFIEYRNRLSLVEATKMAAKTHQKMQRKQIPLDEVLTKRKSVDPEVYKQLLRPLIPDQDEEYNTYVKAWNYYVKSCFLSRETIRISFHRYRERMPYEEAKQIASFTTVGPIPLNTILEA